MYMVFINHHAYICALQATFVNTGNIWVYRKYVNTDVGLNSMDKTSTQSVCVFRSMADALEGSFHNLYINLYSSKTW